MTDKLPRVIGRGRDDGCAVRLQEGRTIAGLKEFEIKLSTQKIKSYRIPGISFSIQSFERAQKWTQHCKHDRGDQNE